MDNFLDNLKHDCIEAQAVSPNYYDGDLFIAWEDLLRAANSFNHKLDLIKSWGNLKAGEFAQEWTEDDELTYRELFGESLMVLPDEVEEEE